VFESEPKRVAREVAPPRGIAIKRITLDELERMIERNKKYYMSNINELFNSDRLIKRFERNLCFVAFKDKKMIHRTWVRIRKGRALIHSAKTLEKYRNKGIYTSILSYVLSYLKRRDVKRIYIESFSTNLPARKAILHVGFKEVKRVRLIRCFGINLFKTKDIFYKI
jgi:GNAT superfamily N-acetyltransferase